MALSVEHNSQIQSLIEQIDQAVMYEEPPQIAEGVKQALMVHIEDGQNFLPQVFVQPVPDGYARRLLHKDPQDRYSVVVMVWGAGQGTPLHDHAGQWCVEGVYRGNIRVRSYELEAQDGDLCQFQAQAQMAAGVGQAGMLIPPFEHHILENPFDETAVTIHVYSQELTWCNKFVPIEGGRYRQERVALSYSD